MSSFDPIKPAVRRIRAYTLPHVEAPVKLNQNENPYEIPDDLKQEVCRYAMDRPWGRYPEFVPDEFLSLLAGHVGWVREGMLAGNGSNELIQAIMSVTCAPGVKVLICQPTFTLYRLLGRVNGAEVIETRLRPDDLTFDVPELVATIRREAPAVVVLCSPNNPTGSALSLDDWRTICEASPGIVVADQAYVEFGGASAIPLLAEYPRLAVLRTFSKAGSLAGLRIGYAACAPELAEEIAKAKLPYNVNFLSIAAASVVVRNWSRFEAVVATLIGERDRVYEALRAMPGIRAYISTANFVLFEASQSPGEVFEWLCDRGVLIRNVSAYPMLERALRVSIGTPDENDRFLTAMQELTGAGNE